MSGIAGIFRFDGAPIEPGLVKIMTAAMSYRGPDGIHHWEKGSVALGHCMLHTTPESLMESQPLANEDENLVLVMDGRVDNWEDLRRELLGCGALLRTRADAELVLRAYQVWGKECLSHIDGDFSLVIWDAHRQEVFCARDRFGNKPFYYRWDGKTFMVASELHAILALPHVLRIPNEGLLAEHLANEWISRDETFWMGIRRLVAAHSMSVNVDGTRIERYWKPDFWTALPHKNADEAAEHYRAVLLEVTRRLSRSHAPVAFEVSGGLDSSALFAVAERLRREGCLPAPAIQGYTLDYHDDPNANELEYARAVGGFLGVPVHEVQPTQYPASWYRNWSEHYRDFPGYPNGIMAVGIREAARRHGCRVVIAGVGGDEWLATVGRGDHYLEELAARQWRHAYACLVTDIRELGLQKALWIFARHGLAPMLPAWTRTAMWKMLGRRKPLPWLSPHLQKILDQRRADHRMPVDDRFRWRGQRLRLQILDGAYNAMAREMEERLGASLGIELRLPFFSREIVQLAFSTPERLRTSGRATKLLHRQAMSGFLPDSVLNRTTKADFMVAFRRHLSTMAVEFRDDIIPRRADWIRIERAREILYKYQEVEYTGWAEWWLWTLFGLDSMFRDY